MIALIAKNIKADTDAVRGTNIIFYLRDENAGRKNLSL